MKSYPGHDMIGTDLPGLDITEEPSVAEFLHRVQPDAVIHCAAFTAVDRCESERELAFAVNATGTANIARACSQAGVWMIAISTDYVFSGDLDRPYTESDPTGPRSVYGESKRAAEIAVQHICPNHTIARIAWLYGPGGPSFVHTMLKLGAEQDSIKVVDDQIGNPTSTLAVAAGIERILGAGLKGIVHLTCEGEATWCDFAREIFRVRGIDCEVTPCGTEEFPRPAPRPRNSRLAKRAIAAAGLKPMPHWRDAIAEFLMSC